MVFCGAKSKYVCPIRLLQRAGRNVGDNEDADHRGCAGRRGRTCAEAPPDIDCIRFVPPVVAVLPPASLVMTPVKTPVPPIVPPPASEFPPSPPPPGTGNPQVDEDPQDNELLQPGRTLSRTMACHQTPTPVRSANMHYSTSARPTSPLLPCPPAGE